MRESELESLDYYFRPAMEETIAELRRQLKEQQKLRGVAERRLQPNTLFYLLDRWHRSLSQANISATYTDVDRPTKGLTEE